jgi:hypothetical protein
MKLPPGTADPRTAELRDTDPRTAELQLGLVRPGHPHTER